MSDNRPMMQLRRIGTAAAPTSLLAGQLAYHQIAGGAAGDLYIGDGTAVQLLVGPSKVWTVSNFRLSGGSAGDILTTNGVGGLSWAPPPSGVGAVTVADPLTGTGVAATPLGLRINTAQLQVTGGALGVIHASNAETLAGTDINKSITPAGLAHVLGDVRIDGGEFS